ncbi:MAG: leucine-rich repeat protein [Coriobacteriales bacterium]|jgi:hypothetical protein
MHKRCLNVFKTFVSASLVLSLSPVAAFAQEGVGSDTTSGASVSAEAQVTTDTSASTQAAEASLDDSVEVQKTDTSKLSAVSETAANAVESYFSDRSSEVEGTGSAADDSSVDLSSSVASTSDERADNFNQMADSANIEVLDASSTVDVTSVDQQGSTISVDAYEQTVFTYDDLSDGKGGSDVAIFGTDHSLEVKATDAEAAIVSDAYDESDLSNIDTTDTANTAGKGSGSKADSNGTKSSEKTAGKAAAKSNASDSAAEKKANSTESGAAEQPAAQSDAQAAGTSDSSSLLSYVSDFFSTAFSLVVPEKAYGTTYDSKYNAAKAIAYSDKYALSYNTKYRNFNSVGGDCANFTSQALKAGKLTTDATGSSASSVWYYKSGSNYSTSWTYCPTFVKYMKKNKGKYIKNPKASQIYPGSPVLYMSSGVWAHATLCVGYNSAGTPVINAHNNDRYHVPYTYWNTTRCTIQMTKTKPTVGTGSTFETGRNASATSTDLKSDADATYTYAILDSVNHTVQLVDYSGTASKAIIPASVKNPSDGLTYKVVAVSDSVFAGNKHITSATIGGQFTKLATGVFKNCTYLKTVTFTQASSASAYVQRTGTSAFEGCTRLTTIKGASQIEKIGKRAFYGCKKLTSISGFTNVNSIGSQAFWNCKKLATLSTFGKTTYVGSSAFRNCDKLTRVSGFPVLKTLKSYTFYDCDGLKSVNITSPKLKTVGAYAFYTDAALSKIYLSSTKLTAIGDYAFYKNKKLSKLKIYSSKINTSKVGFRSFYKVRSKAKIYVPKAQKKSYRSAFRTHGLPYSVKFRSI